MTQRLLFVEQSATMRYVMVKHAESLGFEVDACESYDAASRLLDEQFQQYGFEYNAVIFGWPTTPQDDAQRFAQKLDTSEYKGLAVVVMSTDMRAETRAWIAQREASAVLPWKKYQALNEVLSSLIDSVPSASPSMIETGDHRELHLLVVDGSATIRYSLRDLFENNGYRVTLAATHEEAIVAATENLVDIAILDYYLTDSTGDELCGALLESSETGDIVCTVLTGTYSDHIIKRCLNAGAVECMFKNESSALLLARINALARLTQKNRQIGQTRKILEQVLQSVVGAVMLFGVDEKIVYVSPSAEQLLSLDDTNNLIGYSSEQLMGTGNTLPNAGSVHEASWQLPDGRQIDVDCERTEIDVEGHALLRFTLRAVPIERDNVTILHRDNTPETQVKQIIRQFALLPTAEPLLLQLTEYLNEANQSHESQTGENEGTTLQVSLLLLDVFTCPLDCETESNLTAVASDPTIATLVRTALDRVLVRENHVAQISGGRYAFLLRHDQPSQAYFLTRRVMQHCIELGKLDVFVSRELKVVCSGSLLGVTQHSSQPVGVLVQHAFKGLELVRDRGLNQAMLLDARRLLSAYPVVN